MDLSYNKICRICEKESNYISLIHPDNQYYVHKLLSCAEVTVSK